MRRVAPGWDDRVRERVEGSRISGYEVRVASWAISGLNLFGLRRRSVGGIKDPHQTCSISDIGT